MNAEPIIEIFGYQRRSAHARLIGLIGIGSLETTGENAQLTREVAV